MSFGFLPNEGQPDFDALLKKFSEMGIEANELAGAKSFFESMRSKNTGPGQSLITTANLREIAKKLLQQKVIYLLELPTRINALNHFNLQISGWMLRFYFQQRWCLAKVPGPNVIGWRIQRKAGRA
jgi:hypothetical protein